MANDPVGDQVIFPFAGVTAITGVAAPGACHEDVSDLTQAAVAVEGHEAVLRVSVVALEANLTCQGVALNEPSTLRTTAFYTVGLRTSPDRFAEARPGVFIDARLSEDSPLGPDHVWMFKCGSLAVWTSPSGRVQRSPCLPVTESRGTLELRVPLEGTIMPDGRFPYTIEGSYTLEARAWSARDAGMDGHDAGPTQNVFAFRLDDTLATAPFRMS
jgi:hypothetical protein